MALSYEWTPEEQREYSLAKLIKYIKDYVYPYHPYYRKLFKEQGIDPDKLHSYDDLRRIPITTKEDTAADQKAFILQPKVEDSAYDVEELGKSIEAPPQICLGRPVVAYDRDGVVGAFRDDR